VEPPAPAPPVQKPEPEAPKAQPAPKVIKPPQEAPKKGLPELDAKKPRKTTKATPSPAAASAGGAGSTGRGAQTPGLEFGPPGPGVPGGTDPNGDWYLAGVQRKIWGLWTQQIRTGMTQAVTVRFTIVADGTVEDVEVVQPSGVYLIDAAALRAVTTAAPFSPLPRNYDTTRVTIQAVFKPTT
jgi:TonB family protein